MVAYYLNCLICGCGWGKPVITNVELAKKCFKHEELLICEFPDSFIEDSDIPDKDKKALIKSIKMLPKHKWLTDIIALQPGKNVPVTLKMEDWYDADGNEYKFYDSSITPETYKTKAYIVHKNCLKLLKQNGYDVSYEAFAAVDNMVPARKNVKQHISYNTFKMNYFLANKYIREYGVFYEHAAYLYDPFLIENPLKNTQNAERILALKFPLRKANTSAPKKEIKVPKKEIKVPKKEIPSPSSSATDFEVGKIKIGNDKNKWVVTENANGVKRWKLHVKRDRPSPSESAARLNMGSKKKGNDGAWWEVVEKHDIRRWKKVAKNIKAL